MTKEDIIRMARDSGCDVQEGYVAYCDIDDLCLFAEKVHDDKRKPLTDEQIVAIANSLRWSDHYHFVFARAIEAAHGIKGEA